jgi:hypothetical protein
MKLRNWSNCLITWILLFVFKGQDCNIQERGHGRFTPNMLWCPLLSTDLFLALHDWRFKPPTFLGLSFSVRASWIGMGPFKNSWTLIPYFVRVLLLMVKWVCETWGWQWLGQVRFIPSSSTPSSFGSSDRFFMALFLLMIFIYLFFKFYFNI